MIGKYKEIVKSLYIQPKNEVIVGCFIEKNDYDKDENWIGLPMKRKKKDFFKKLEQRKAWSKDKTKDIRTVFKITEKRGNGENEQVQENVPVDNIETKWEKRTKKNISRTLIFAIWLFSKTSRIFIFANTGFS